MKMDTGQEWQRVLGRDQASQERERRQCDPPPPAACLLFALVGSDHQHGERQSIFVSVCQCETNSKAALPCEQESNKQSRASGQELVQLARPVVWRRRTTNGQIVCSQVAGEPLPPGSQPGGQAARASLHRLIALSHTIGHSLPGLSVSSTHTHKRPLVANSVRPVSRTSG